MLLSSCVARQMLSPFGFGYVMKQLFFFFVFKLLGTSRHISKVGWHEEIRVPYRKKQNKSGLRQGK